MLFFQMDDDNDRESVIIVVLEGPNLQRMAMADPVSINPMETGGVMKAVKYPDNLTLLIAYEEDAKTLHQIISQGNMQQVFAHLFRGYTITPQDGKAKALEVHANGGPQA